MLSVYRLVLPNFTDTAFSGEGSRLYGGRWNSKGNPMVYTASTISLALLEMAVQADPIKLNYSCIRADIPDDLLIMEIDIASLHKDWQTTCNQELQEIGDGWAAEKKSAVLKVPSAVVPIEFNYLINPLHDDFNKIMISPPFDFTVDQRLLK